MPRFGVGLGSRVRSLPSVWNRRMGLGQSLDLLCAHRRGSVCQSMMRQLHRLDRRVLASITRFTDSAVFRHRISLYESWDFGTSCSVATNFSRRTPIACRSAICGPALHTNLAAVRTRSNFEKYQAPLGRCGSRASFERSGGDFRYYPERRHLLALHQVTQGAISGLTHRNMIGL